jgi:hypothetical protein
MVLAIDGVGDPRPPDTITAAPPPASPPEPSPLGGDALAVGSSAIKGTVTHDFSGWFPQGPLPRNGSLTDAHGYTYTSDFFGRPKTASGDLGLNPAPNATRDAAARRAQRAAGIPDRLPNDEGGHGIGNRFFGRNDAWNLTPQDGNLNVSAYKAMENSWARTLQGPRGGTPGTVRARVEAVYDEPTLRPTDYVARYTQNGGRSVLRVMENAPHAGFTAEVGTIGKNEKLLTTMGKVSEGLDTFGKVALPVAVAAVGVRLYGAYEEDGGKIGRHTAETAGSVAGGWAGAAAGAEGGAEAGAAVGAFFGGAGAVPGAIVGGLVGGVAGGIVGSGLGEDAVKLGEHLFGGLF